MSIPIPMTSAEAWLAAIAPKIDPTVNAPAEGGPVGAAEAWHDAISGRGPQFTGMADTKAAAADWMGQFVEMRK